MLDSKWDIVFTGKTAISSMRHRHRAQMLRHLQPILQNPWVHPHLNSSIKPTRPIILRPSLLSMLQPSGTRSLGIQSPPLRSRHPLDPESFLLRSLMEESIGAYPSLERLEHLPKGSTLLPFLLVPPSLHLAQRNGPILLYPARTPFSLNNSEMLRRSTASGAHLLLAVRHSS